MRPPPASPEGDGEVEPLAEAPEGDEGLAWEAARGHLAVGLLVLPRRAVAHDPAHQSVGALPAVLTHARHAAARVHVHLAVVT